MSSAPPNTQIRAGRRDRRGLPEGEQTIFHRHHHWTLLARMIALPVILTVVALVLLLIFTAQLSALPYDSAQAAASNIIQVLLIAFLLISLLAIAYQAWNWLADSVTLTNRRLIVRDATPLVREQRREIPLGKVQNVTTTLPGPLNKSLNYGLIVVDTAGLGQLRITNLPEPALLRDQIMTAQKAVLAASVPTREHYRQEVIRSILYNTPAPPPPQGVLAVQPSPRTGYDTFNRLFPFRPQRDGLTVIWHKHWWFLVTSELVPILIVLFFELVGLATTIVFNLIGSAVNPATPVLAVVRPFIWIVALIAALYQWEDWRNDYYEIRGDRLIDREARPLGLFEETKQTEINRITDIRNDVPGPLAMLLDFGDVLIKTPGESAIFTFDRVPRPREVLGEIMDRIEAQRERDQFQTARDMQDLLRAYTQEIQHWQSYQAQQPPKP